MCETKNNSFVVIEKINSRTPIVKYGGKDMKMLLKYFVNSFKKRIKFKIIQEGGRNPYKKEYGVDYILVDNKIVGL